MEKLLTAKEVAEILNCHEQTVYRNQELPLISLPGVGKRCRESDLNKYLEQNSTFSPYFLNNQPISLTESPVLPILSLGGETHGMPKGKNKTRYNFGYGAIYQRKTKHGKIRWYMDYRDGNGERIQKVAPLATTKEEAVIALRKEVQQTFDKEYSIKRKKGKIKLCELADMYLESYAKPNKRSWETDNYRMNANILPFFGQFELDSINPLMIEKYRAQRLKTDVKKSTLNRELALIKKMINQAIDWNLTDTNPALKVKSFPEKDNLTERILSQEEEKRLLESSSDHLKSILMVALNTGMRLGEILKLKWQNIDLNSRKIRVEQTKSGKIRFINVNTPLFELLSKLHKNNPSSQYLFLNPKTGDRLKSVKTAFKAA